MSIEYEMDFDLDVVSALEIRDAVEAAGKHIGEIARDKAPELTGAALKKANEERRGEIGALKASMFVEPIDDHTVAVGFSEFYAGWQHERMDYHHEDGEAKFLERPLIENRSEALDIMAEGIAKAIRK